GSAIVTVNTPPSISVQPGSLSRCVGGSATFSVTASGTSLTYQWRKNGVALVNGGNIAGATSASLTVSSLGGGDAASYDVVVSGTCPPSVTSNPATLTVNPVPSCSITGADPVCASSTGNNYSGPPGMTGYSWSIAGGTITAGGTSQTVTVTAGAGASFTLTLTVTDSNGCQSTCTKTVTINPLPSATITPTAAVCANSTGNTASVPSAGAGATYTWGI